MEQSDSEVVHTENESDNVVQRLVDFNRALFGNNVVIINTMSPTFQKTQLEILEEKKAS